MYCTATKRFIKYFLKKYIQQSIYILDISMGVDVILINCFSTGPHECFQEVWF